MTFPDSFTPIHTPMLPEMAGITSKAQFVALFYQGSKPTWTDGRVSATFNFYQVWQPLSDHPAIAIPLAITLHSFPVPADGWTQPGLGSDDCQATHLLMLDLHNQSLAIAPSQQGHNFLNQQHPPITPLSPAQQAALRQAVADTLNSAGSLTLAEANRLGMFEWFTQPDPSLIEQRHALIQFLDDNLDPQIHALLQRFRA